MKTITITTQQEFDALPDSFVEYTEIEINGKLDIINRIFNNADITIRGGTIQYVYGGTIQYVYGGTIQSVHEGTIQYVHEGTIQYVCGGTIIQVISNQAIIKKARQEAVIIYRGCKGKPLDVSGNVSILYKKQAKHTLESFLDFYELKPTKAGFITLYKSVNPDTNCDFYTGEIKYEGVVECPDWNPDVTIQCGNGLHLSATPEDALGYNNGKILKCKVNIKDIVVYPHDISKVRCKKVKVLKEK